MAYPRAFAPRCGYTRSVAMSAMKNRRRIGVLAVIGLVVVGIIAIPRIIEAAKPVESDEHIAPVSVAKPSLGTLSQSLDFTGHLKPETTTTVVAKINGRLLSLAVAEGQQVKEGQVVARLEDDVVRLQMEQASAAYRAANAQYQKANQAVRPEELESAKASLNQAEEDLVTARTNLERTKNLYEAGSMSKSKYEDAQNAVRSGETQVDNARRQVKLMEDGARQEDIAMAKAQAEASSKQLALAQLQLNDAQVTSPISGVVVKIHAERGNMLGVGSPILTIVSDSTIFATISVPEQYYGQYYTSPNKYDVKVSPIAYADREPFGGKITTVAGAIDGNTRTFEVEIAVDNHLGLLKPGMFVHVTTELKNEGSGLLLPSNAVLLRDGANVVFTLDELSDATNRTVSMKKIRVGQNGNGHVQVLEGLSEQDIVVVQGNAFLENGQSVVVVDGT